MSFLLDTNAWIAYVRQNNQKLVQRLLAEDPWPQARRLAMTGHGFVKYATRSTVPRRLLNRSSQRCIESTHVTGWEAHPPRSFVPPQT